MKPFDPIAFVTKHGIVLSSARHASVPSLAAAIAGEPIRGSWWGHPRAQEIFRALNVVSDHPDVVVTKLVDGKVTLVHRRLWPALATLVAAGKLAPARAARVEQEHTATGKHVSRTVPFARWLPPGLPTMTEAVALRALAAAL
jgi:hypothetical protein